METNCYQDRKKDKANSHHLRELRAKIVVNGLKYKDVAADLGISKSHLCHVLNGRKATRVMNYLERLPLTEKVS